MGIYDTLFSLPFLFMFFGTVGMFFNISEIMIVSIAFLLVFLVYLFIDLIFYDKGTLLQKSLLILSFVLLLADLLIFTEISTIFCGNVFLLCLAMMCMSESLFDPDYHQLISSNPKFYLVFNIYILIVIFLLILTQKTNLTILVSISLINVFVFSTIFYSFKGMGNMDESKF